MNLAHLFQIKEVINMQKKIEFKDLSFWLKVGVVGGVYTAMSVLYIVVSLIYAFVVSF